MRSVYLDYNATTPLDPAVREAMLPAWTEVFGNPSSVHQEGRRARALLDEARQSLAECWRCKPSEVIFTSGGTESNNLAILGTARHLRDHGQHIITSSIEHPAVLHACQYLAAKEHFEITILPVDDTGRVSVSSLESALRSDTILVSIMAANNEIGTIQPVAELGALCRQRRVLFHTDAVQWFGKESFTGMEQFNADLVSVCAHKFHGPKGVGALYIRSPLHPDNLLFGGAQENERRPGTENLAAILGLTNAFTRFVSPPVFQTPQMPKLTGILLEMVDTLGEGVLFRGSRTHRLKNTIAFTAEGCDSMTLLAALDLEGVCASSGSACSVGSIEPSHVLSAMGVPKSSGQSLIRFSLGRENTLAEVEYVASLLPKILHRVQVAGKDRNHV